MRPEKVIRCKTVKGTSDHWPLRFDRTIQSVGITQTFGSGSSRVKLSPRQARALVKFIYPRKVKDMGL